MDIVLSHTTALEAYRAGAATSPSRRELPGKAPEAAELLAWASRSDLGRSLTVPLTLLVGETNGRKETSACRARYSAPLPDGSLASIGDGARIVSPELLLVQMSRIATPVELAMLVCELCGLYSLSHGNLLGMAQREHPLTSIERISAYVGQLGAVPGVRSLRAALALSFDRSASPMESKLAARVSWPRSKGGYNVPVISMNEGIEVARISRNLSRARVRKPDLLFSLPQGETPGICLDYHGGVHRGGARPEQDAARMNELLAFGLRPYALWHEQYRGTAYLDGLIDGVVRHELGLPRPRAAKAREALELARREALLAELDAVDGMSWGTSGAGAEALRARELVDEARSRL